MKNCPFCGSENVTEGEQAIQFTSLWCVKCDDCGARGPHVDKYSTRWMRDKWNERSLEKKLLDALVTYEEAAGYSFETEYDGRMYEICHFCQSQDGAHNSTCEYPQIKALVEEASQITN